MWSGVRRCCAYATVGLASTGKGKGGAFYRRLRKDTARRPGSTSRSAHPKATILILSSHIVKGCISLNPQSAPEMALECDTRAAVIIYWPQNSLLVNEILAKAPVNQRRESSREISTSNCLCGVHARALMKSHVILMHLFGGS